jgi:cell division protease FtsH
MEYGMSEAVGLMAVGEREQEVFLGREFGSRRETSERTAELVDEEVKRFVDEAFATALRLLNEHHDLLERIALALLERETIDRDDLDLLARNLPLPPRAAAPPPPSAPPGVPVGRESPALRGTPPILGAPPAEPAGA